MTTIPVSTAPAAKAKLVALITAQVHDPAVIVCYDGPGTRQADDIVSVGRVEREVTASAMVGSGGAGWLSERYIVVVEVGVFRGGDDPAATDQRMWALVAAVETAVRADPSLGDTVSTARPSLTRTDSSFDTKHLGRVSQAEVHITCNDRS